MSQEYVEEREGAYYVAGSRVSLASVIFAFRDGASPETIKQNFSSLSLGQVYGAIAFFLNHPAESKSYLERLAARWRELEQHGHPPPEELRKKIEEARVEGGADGLAFQRLEKALEPMGTTTKNVAMAHCYPLSNSIAEEGRKYIG